MAAVRRRFAGPVLLAPTTTPGVSAAKARSFFQQQAVVWHGPSGLHELFFLACFSHWARRARKAHPALCRSIRNPTRTSPANRQPERKTVFSMVTIGIHVRHEADVGITRSFGDSSPRSVRTAALPAASASKASQDARILIGTEAIA